MKLTINHNKAYNNSFQEAEEIELVQSGSSFFDKLLDLIDSAKSTLHLQMYIINSDSTGMSVLKALKHAVKRGVKVYVVADDFGSRILEPEYKEALIKAGISFRLFMHISIFKNLSIGRRLHHKVVVADGYRALVGGINIDDKYHGTKSEEAWLDFAIYIRGSVCQKLEKICLQIQEKKYTQKRPYIHKLNPRKDYPHISIRQNDWVRNKKQISYSYNYAIRNAKEYIIIFASYFLPGLRIKRALEAAARRGVQISIILAGVSDIPSIINATPYLYGWLHRNNIRVYEWEKSVLHAKLAVIDDQWCTVGSFNLNHLSAYASIELNIDVLDDSFAIQARRYLQKVIEEGCKEIPKGEPKPILIRIREFIAYILGRSLMMTITFFPNFRNIYSKMID